MCIACSFTIAVSAAMVDVGTRAAEKSKIDCKSTGDPTTGDAVDFTYNKRERTLLIKVTYRRGIGGAKVSWTKGSQPRKIVVELQNFHNLEALAMSGGGSRLQTALKVAPMIWGKSSTDENEHELKPHVEVTSKTDSITAVIPGEAYDWNVQEVLIGWIDAYR
jgi:hypothetical protein